MDFLRQLIDGRVTRCTHKHRTAILTNELIHNGGRRNRFTSTLEDKLYKTVKKTINNVEKNALKCLTNYYLVDPESN